MKIPANTATRHDRDRPHTLRVEADPANRMFMKTVLRFAHHDIAIAAEGKSANTAACPIPAP